MYNHPNDPCEPSEQTHFINGMTPMGDWLWYCKICDEKVGMHQCTRHELILKVLCWPEISEDRIVWVAQCLEHDIAAQAKGFAGLEAQLERVIIARFVIAKERRIDPLKSLGPASKPYWDRWASAKARPTVCTIFPPSESLEPSIRSIVLDARII